MLKISACLKTVMHVVRLKQGMLKTVICSMLGMLKTIICVENYVETAC